MTTTLVNNRELCLAGRSLRSLVASLQPRRRVADVHPASSPLVLFGLRFFFDRQQRFRNSLESSRGDRDTA
jgi:hypothetical protein